jgi:hypothetical protein
VCGGASAVWGFEVVGEVVVVVVTCDTVGRTCNRR